MEAGDARLEHWVQFLHALPFPAALVDESERVIEANRLVGVPDDLLLLAPRAEDRSPMRSRAGADGQTRWRLVPLIDDGSIQLVTEEGDAARNHLLQVFFATGNALFVVFDPSGTVLEANDAWGDILGFGLEEMLGLDAWTLVHPDDLLAHQTHIVREVSETGRSDRLLRVRGRDGTYREVQWTFYFDAALDQSFGIGRDVTQDREQERILRDSHRMFEQVGEFLLVLDLNGVVLSANPALYETLDVGPDDVVGHELASFVHPDDQHRIIGAATEAQAELMITERLTRWRSPNQTEWRWIDSTVAFDPEYDRFHIVARDVTAEHELTAELERRAYTDELTGLANRARLLDSLDDYLAGPATPAVLFCDLDRFKVVNDSLGHHAGDELLRQLARVLESQATAEDSLVARIGGDEFVILLGNADEARAVDAARFVLRLMNEPFTVQGRRIHAAASIGISVARPGTGPGPGRTADTLLSEADTAAYRAKDLGRGRYAIHDDRMRREAQRRFDVEVGLRRAVEDDEFVVHYQPIVALPGGGVTGVEALVRWPSPEGELRMPVAFLDVAEEAGLMDQIGARVLTTALRQGARLADHGRTLLVSVNVAAPQLADRGFADEVIATLEETGFRPENLLLELTESAILANNEANIRTLTRLRAAGVKIGLDDFGTGFSSLSHLQNLPIDVVKIDRSFVAALNDGVTRAVTSSVVSLCRALGLEVILEGIETADQLSAVEQLGGSSAQGYFFHRPMPAEQLEDLLGVGRSRYPMAPASRSAAIRSALQPQSPSTSAVC